MTIGWILLATCVAGVLSAVAAWLIAFALPRTILPHLVSFAVGMLLGAAFLDLIPHATTFMPMRPPQPVLAAVLAGVFGCLLIENALHWQHARSPLTVGGAARIKPAGTMILIGGALHNFADGVLIAAAFLTDAGLGLAVTLAVVAHEIPREMGDVGILLDAGLSWQRTLVYNTASSAAAIVGGVAGCLALSVAQPAVRWVIAIAAGSFIYIAIADLLPQLRDWAGPRDALARSAVVGAGIACMALAVGYLH